MILQGDALGVLRTLPDSSVNCCVTSPPYWSLRDYGMPGQLGLEPTPEEYVAKLVAIFSEVRRVLREDGSAWVNLGDTYASGAVKNTGRNDENESDVQRRFERFGTGRAKARTCGNDTGAIRVEHGLKSKDLVGIPWRVAFALQADGWYLRSDIIWAKPNPMPESVTDRPTKAHEYIFFLSKSERYWYDAEAIKESLAVSNAQRTTAKYNTATRYGAGNGGNDGLDRLAARMRRGEVAHRNKRSVWTVATQPFKEAHFAVFPEALIEPCILAGCPRFGTVLDPFSGSGTTGVVAMRHEREYIGIELNPAYVAMSEKRLAKPDQVRMELTA